MNKCRFCWWQKKPGNHPDFDVYKQNPVNDGINYQLQPLWIFVSTIRSVGFWFVCLGTKRPQAASGILEKFPKRNFTLIGTDSSTEKIGIQKSSGCGPTLITEGGGHLKRPCFQVRNFSTPNKWSQPEFKLVQNPILRWGLGLKDRAKTAEGYTPQSLGLQCLGHKNHVMKCQELKKWMKDIKNISMFRCFMKPWGEKFGYLFGEILHFWIIFHPFSKIPGNHRNQTPFLTNHLLEVENRRLQNFFESSEEAIFSMGKKHVRKLWWTFSRSG